MGKLIVDKLSLVLSKAVQFFCLLKLCLLSYKVSSSKEFSGFQHEPSFLLGYSVGKMWRKDTKEGPAIVKQGKGKGFNRNFKYTIRTFCYGMCWKGKSVDMELHPRS